MERLVSLKCLGGASDGSSLSAGANIPEGFLAAQFAFQLSKMDFLATRRLCVMVVYVHTGSAGSEVASFAILSACSLPGMRSWPGIHVISMVRAGSWSRK